MSIVLEGKFDAGIENDGTSSLRWQGTWQFAKEMKFGFPFLYKRSSSCIPRDLICYVSFITSTNSEEDKQEECNGTVTGSDRVLGLWEGSFEVAGANGPASISEIYFLCGVLGEGMHGTNLGDLPPPPTFSPSVLKRPDFSKLVLPAAAHEDGCELDRIWTTTEAAESNKVYFGFGRNQFGRFSIIMALDAHGVAFCEKKYMLSKFGNNMKRPKSAVCPATAISRTEVRDKSSRISVGTRYYGDSYVDETDVINGKRRRISQCKPKYSLEDAVDGADCRQQVDESDRGNGAPIDDDDDYKAAFLDEETGEIYEGSWAMGLRQGHGICLYVDGTMYEGSWVLGREQGNGTLMSGDRQVMYVGEWLDGLMSGHGSYFYSNGDVYCGDWKEGLRQGRGEYLLKNGCRYLGDWKDNKRQGKGVFVWPDGSKYDGDWENDMRHGRGVLHISSGFSYDGMWHHNHMEGRGVCTFPGGQEYHGTFKQGLREGRGSINFPEGAVYEGRFREDRIDGQGTIKIEKPVAGSMIGEMLIPIQIQADIRRIHLKAGFGQGSH